MTKLKHDGVLCRWGRSSRSHWPQVKHVDVNDEDVTAAIITDLQNARAASRGALGLMP